MFGLIFDELDELDALAAKKMAPHDRLSALSSAYVTYWLEHTEHYRLVFMAEGVTQPEVSVFMEDPKLIARYNVFAVAILDATGELSQEALKLKGDALVCFLHGIAHNLITMTGYSWPNVDNLIDIALSEISKTEKV